MFGRPSSRWFNNRQTAFHVMHTDRNKAFVEDAVIRMRDLRDQEDCFSREEFRDRLRTRFFQIAGVRPRRPTSLREVIIALAVVPAYTLFAGFVTYWRTGEPDLVSALVAVFMIWLCGLLMMASGGSVRTWSIRRISKSVRLASVDALVQENLITEKQDRALRRLIEETEIPQRFTLEG